jgi:hypothetical protein
MDVSDHTLSILALCVSVVTGFLSATYTIKAYNRSTELPLKLKTWFDWAGSAPTLHLRIANHGLTPVTLARVRMSWLGAVYVVPNDEIIGVPFKDHVLPTIAEEWQLGIESFKPAQAHLSSIINSSFLASFKPRFWRAAGNTMNITIEVELSNDRAVRSVMRLPIRNVLKLSKALSAASPSSPASPMQAP